MEEQAKKLEAKAAYRVGRRERSAGQSLSFARMQFFDGSR
jgi:hypothetical protein